MSSRCALQKPFGVVRVAGMTTLALCCGATGLGRLVCCAAACPSRPSAKNTTGIVTVRRHLAILAALCQLIRRDERKSVHGTDDGLTPPSRRRCRRPRIRLGDGRVMTPRRFFQHSLRRPCSAVVVPPLPSRNTVVATPSPRPSPGCASESDLGMSSFSLRELPRLFVGQLRLVREGHASSISR